MRKFITTLILCGIGSFAVSGQNAPDKQTEEYILEIKPGKKVLHIDMLNIAPTTTLSEILDLFPELLSREGDSHLENYDLQINDISTSASAENLLDNIFANEIKEIEVSQSPDMSQKVNGQGGVINVKMKDPEYGLGGKAMISGSSMVDAMPSGEITYRTDKLQIRSSVLFEYYHPLDNIDLKENQGEYVTLTRQTDTTDTQYFSQSARFYLKYSFNPKGYFETWVIEDYVNDRNNTKNHISSFYGPGEVLRYRNDEMKNDSGIMVNSNAKYKQDWERGGVEASLQYIFNNKGKDYSKKYDRARTPSLMNDKLMSHGLKTVLKAKYKAIPTSATRKLELTAGVNCNYTFKRYEYNEYMSICPIMEQTAGYGMLVSPYLEADCVLGPVFLKGGINYQYNTTNFQVDGKSEHPDDNHNFTANLKAGWQIVPHHHLSLILDRSVRNPAVEQIYPHMTFKPFSGEYLLGNVNLESELLNTVNLNYIFDTKVGEHSFIANVSGQYIRTDNIINSVTKTNPVTKEKYIYYENDGFSNIFNANAMLHYDYEIFQMQVTANIFKKWQTIGGIDDTYAYYNLAVIPRLNFPHQWKVFLKIQYHSPVVTKRYELSDYSYGELTVSKTWNKLTVSLFAGDLFHKTAVDVYYDKELDYHAYNLHRREYGAAISFKF